MSVMGLGMQSGILTAVADRIADGLQRNRLALLLALVVHVADVVSTQVAFSLGIPEANPVPAMLVASGGSIAIFGVKFAVIAAVVLLACLLGRRYTRLWKAITVTNALMVVVVISNTAQIMST